MRPPLTRPAQLRLWLILLGLVLIGWAVWPAFGVEIRFQQGEPPPVAAWRVWRLGTRTPVATVLPTQLQPWTPAPYPTPGPNTPTPAIVRAYRVDVPALLPGVAFFLDAIGVDGQISVESNVQVSDTATPTATTSETPTITPPATSTRSPTRSPTAVPPRPHRPQVLP